MSMLPHTLQKPLPPQRSQTPLMQMITLHPEQHIRHRKQRQRHKQVNPMPSHKRKLHNPQDSYQRQRRPTTSKILVNENVRQSLRNNYTWFTGCLSTKNTDPSFLKLLKNFSASKLCPSLGNIYDYKQQTDVYYAKFLIAIKLTIKWSFVLEFQFFL